MMRVALACIALLLPLAVAGGGSGKVFVSSEKDNVLVVVDAARGDVVGTLAACRRPRHLQRTPDGRRLLVACSDDDQVLALELPGGQVAERYPVGDDPETFDLSPDGRTLYASNEDEALLTAYDLAGRRKLFEVKVGGEPEGVKVSADGRLVYVASEVASLVHVVDVARREVVKNIPVGQRPRRFLLAGGELWVTNELGASVSVIRTSDHAVVATLDFLPPGMRPEHVTPVGMALAPDGRTAYVGLGRANHVAVVDVAGRKVRAYVLVGQRAWGLGLSRDGRRLYVANGLSDDLSIVDTARLKAVRTVKVGRVPHSVVVDD